MSSKRPDDASENLPEQPRSTATDEAMGAATTETIADKPTDATDDGSDSATTEATTEDAPGRAASQAPDEGKGVATAAKYHDALFKHVFGDPAHAAEALRAILPPQVAAHFDWNSIEPDRASVVADDLAQRHGDLLFRARLLDARTAFIRLLFEHQSTPDRWMSWRMTEMSYELLREARQRQPDAEHLPAVLSVVLYQGTQPWRAPTSLLELTDLSEQARGDLGPYLLSLRYVLDDLRVVAVADIDARAMSPVPRLALGVMKHYQSEEVHVFLLQHADDLRTLYEDEQHGRIWLALLLSYTWTVNRHTSRDRVMRLVSPLVGDDLERTMQTIQQFVEQANYETGREDGIEQGIEKGIEKGQRALLLRLLTRRFGVLPEPVLRRVAGAGTADLERWGERIFDAASLDDVFTAP